MSVFQANWEHHCYVDNDVMRELLKFAPWPLINCKSCSVIHRADTWCSCPDALDAQAKWELSQRLPLAASQVADSENAQCEQRKRAGL